MIGLRIDVKQDFMCIKGDSQPHSVGLRMYAPHKMGYNRYNPNNPIDLLPPPQDLMLLNSQQSRDCPFCCHL
jgi:hypothetical protein